MINLIKLAEVYGSEAIVYNGSNAPPDVYIDLIVNNKLEPGMGAGDAYGKGVYTTYNLPGTATASGTYGGFIYKLKVNLYGFISFNPDITKKIYGEDLAPSQQYEKIYGRRDYIFKELIALESRERFSQFSSDLADPASKFLRGRVKGLIFTGRNDGDVAVIYDPLTIIPIAWKKTGDDSWSSFDKDQIKPAIGRGISGSFEKSKYDEVDASKDRGAKESIDILSNFHGDNPGKMEIESINYLIANAPTTFLLNYSERNWAKDYIKSAIDRSLFMISPIDFVESFRNKPWFDSNSESAAKSLAEREPYSILSKYTNEPWAQEHIPTAAKAYAERYPSSFIENYINEPWAKEHIPTAAKNYAKSDPFNFLLNFRDEPWAEPHLPTAVESDPYSFLCNFVKENWAQEYIPTAVKYYAEKAPYKFLSTFSDKSWAKKYIPTLIENCSDADLTSFLKNFIRKDWAQPYIPTVAKNLAEKNPHALIQNFQNEDWAKEPREDLRRRSFIQHAAKNLAEKEPYRFLGYYGNDPWAQPYIASIIENISKKKSSYSTRLTKLAKVIRSIGLSKEAASILNLK